MDTIIERGCETCRPSRHKPKEIHTQAYAILYQAAEPAELGDVQFGDLWYHGSP